MDEPKAAVAESKELRNFVRRLYMEANNIEERELKTIQDLRDWIGEDAEKHWIDVKDIFLGRTIHFKDGKPYNWIEWLRME